MRSAVGPAVETLCLGQHFPQLLGGGFAAEGLGQRIHARIQHAVVHHCVLGASKAGRAAIAAAQRKRWAESKEHHAAPEAPKPKRKLSAAGRRAIIAATKKRWAAKRAEAAKQTGAQS